MRCSGPLSARNWSFWTGAHPYVRAGRIWRPVSRVSSLPGLRAFEGVGELINRRLRNLPTCPRPRGLSAHRGELTAQPFGFNLCPDRTFGERNNGGNIDAACRGRTGNGNRHAGIHCRGWLGVYPVEGLPTGATAINLTAAGPQSERPFCDAERKGGIRGGKPKGEGGNVAGVCHDAADCCR